MAINSIILSMSASGQSATMELPDGKWCHTPEYFKVRYGSGRAKPVSKPSDSGQELIGVALRKLTPSERILLMAQLVEE